MPTWVNYSKAQAFHAIRKAFAYSTSAFRTAVQTGVRAGTAWTREIIPFGGLPPARQGTSIMQVDVLAVPGVVPLRSDGHPLGKDGAPDL